jgi:hypothetical protein
MPQYYYRRPSDGKQEFDEPLVDPDQYRHPHTQDTSTDDDSGTEDAEEEVTATSTPSVDELASKESEAPAAGETGAGAATQAEKQGATDGLYKGGGLSDEDKKKNSFWLRNKKKILFTGAGGGILGTLIIFLIFLAGSLMLPDFVQNVTSWQFAKVTRLAVESTKADLSENMGQLAQSDAQHLALINATKKLATPITSKLGALNWQTINNKIGTSGAVQFNSQTTLTGRQQLTSVTLNTEGQPSRVFTINGGVTNTFDRINTYSALFDEYMKLTKLSTPNAPWPIRLMATKSALGLSWKGLLTAKFAGKSANASAEELAKESYEQVDDKSAAGTGSKNSKINGAAEEVSQSLDNCVETDEKCLQGIVNNQGQLPDATLQALDKSVSPTGLQKVLGKISDLTSPLTPIAEACGIYDYSRYSPEVSKSQNKAVMNTAAMVLSTGSQQQRGTQGQPDDFNVNAGNAMAQKIGPGINQSNAMVRANGGTIDTTQNLDTNSSILGTYGEATIFTLILPQSMAPLTRALNASADSTCPIFSNAWVNLSAGAVNVAVLTLGAIFSGGTEDAAQEAGTTALKEAVQAGLQRLATQLADKFTTKAGLKELFGGTLSLARDTAKYGAEVAAASFIAKLAVSSQAGILHSGLTTGQAFDDDADNGANQIGNETCRQQYFGRFLTNSEAAASFQQDKQTVAAENASQSTFQRYFATSNANSLLSRMAVTTASTVQGTSATKAFANVTTIFNPLTFVASVFSGTNSKAQAADNVDTQNYGNVQCGWTQAEMDLIHGDESYASPTQNEIAFEQEQKDKNVTVADIYGKCFTDPIPDLIAAGDLDRDPNTGDVQVDDALCSPKNLGPNNPKYGDLVFRYRISNNRNNTADMLTDLQNADLTAPTTSNTNASGQTQ